MCVAAFAWRAHPRWLIAAIGNRDELHDRPAAPLSAWEDQPAILAGRDLKSAGTWLGVSQIGRFALVTNRRGYGGPDPGRVSRGALVSDVLSRSGAYADPALSALGDFNPFNLLVADRDHAWFLTNRPDPVRAALAHGVYGLSNGALDEPWPKTLQLKGALVDWLAAAADAEPDFAPLFAALRQETHPDLGMPPREPSDAPLEPRDSGPFINDERYGTRCCTIVLIDYTGHGVIYERRFDRHAAPTGETRLAFRWPV